MTTTKRQHTAEMKVQVVLALLKEDETMAQICSRFKIHSTQARRWRELALESLKTGFGHGTARQQLEEKERQIEELYKRIGQLNVETEWLKKKTGVTISF
jgi:transposase